MPCPRVPPRFVRHATLAMLAATLSWPAVAAQGDAPTVDTTVARIGEYVRQYSARAQSLVAHEAITIQPIDRTLAADGFARMLDYETRFEWDPAGNDGKGAATVVRELIKSRGPTFGYKKGDDCFDPGPISPEPLAFLMPGGHDDVVFRRVREANVNGQPSLIVDYRKTSPGPSSSTFDEKTGCGTMTVNGRVDGRVWVDRESYAVLRVEEGLAGPVDVALPPDKPRLGIRMTLVRQDASIRYKETSFVDPEESWMLPEEIVYVSFSEGSSLSSRVRVTQRFSNYRRYVTASRLLVD